MSPSEHIPTPVVILLACLWLLSPGSPARAQHGGAAPEQADAPVLQRSGPTDPQELEAFLDPLFAEAMEELHIPGAVFLVVKHGEIFFAKGYGFADLDQQLPVVPDRTLFDVQSVTKLFTVTAVMQVAERGLLKLDDDVNRHLELFKLEETFPQPVTVASLMTHTSGLEDRGTGTTVRTAPEVTPLGEYLAASLPSRVQPPGQVMIYSDQAICLAGYLVEVVSGVPLRQFLTDHILRPLGMERSGFLMLPPELASDLARAYSWENGAYRILPHDFYNIWASSSLMTTATDMARFMIAHLQDGRYGQSRILSEASAQAMHRRQFTHHPRFAGVGYDFFEHLANGQRAIGHGGSGSGFNTELLLLPDYRMGYFVSVNAAESGLLHLLRRRFLDHYFPAEKSSIRVPPAIRRLTRSGRLEGWYWFNRNDRRTIEKLGSILEGYRHVVENPDGSLSAGTGRYTEVEPLLFQRIDAPEAELLSFRVDPDGRITHLLTPGTAYERVRWYQAPPFHLGLLAFVVLAFLPAGLVRPIGALVRHRRSPSPPAPRGAVVARLWAGLISILSLAALLVTGLSVARTAIPSVEVQFQRGIPEELVALLAVVALLALLSAGLPVFAVLAWRNRYGSRLGRVYYSALTLAAVALVWLLDAWNLLGFRY